LQLPAHAFDPGTFQLLPFMIQFAVSAGYLISWAPYVSDYSRYLPPTVGVRSVFLWTYLGMSLSSIWLLGLGALIAQAYPGQGVIETIRAAGDSIFAGFGSFALLVALPGLIVVMALNLYGGSLTLLTIVDTFKPLKPTVRARIVSIVAVMLLGLGLVYLSGQEFLTSFGIFLTFLLYLFGPWTAINLVDFYFVRRGHYSITEIFNPKGMYGVWNWRGLSAYGIGFISTIPFQSTLIYTGPIAAAIGGVDIAPYVGIAVAGLAYKLLAGSIDLKAEQRRIEERDAGLDDGFAASSDTPDRGRPS
jgi:purine-cytosine permease-like protein